MLHPDRPLTMVGTECREPQWNSGRTVVSDCSVCGMHWVEHWDNWYVFTVRHHLRRWIQRDERPTCWTMLGSIRPHLGVGSAATVSLHRADAVGFQQICGDMVSRTEVALRMKSTPEAIRKLWIGAPEKSGRFWGRAMIREDTPVDDMSLSRSIPRSVDDPQVVEAVEQYLASLDTGQAPDRQQLLDRFPQLASELSACLDGLEFIHQSRRNIMSTAPKVRMNCQRPGRRAPAHSVTFASCVRSATGAWGWSTKQSSILCSGAWR